VARLSGRVQSGDLSEVSLQSGDVSINSDDEYHDAADANSDDQALRNYNVPVAALMIHAELPCVWLMALLLRCLRYCCCW
jgi:hypothetical protein